MNKSPAFQFYPADYLSDMRVRMLSWASRGLYMDLLCYCWREGWIPSDSSAIAQLCGCHDLAIVEPCLSLFNGHPEDSEKLIHTRLDKERAKQKEFSEERKSSGIKGAEKRWGKNSLAIKQPIAKNGSSSSSSTSSSDVNTLKSIKAKGSLEDLKSYAVQIGLPESDGESMFDHWEANGWKNGAAASKDWKAGMRKWKGRSWMPSQQQSKATKHKHAGIHNQELIEKGF